MFYFIEMKLWFILHDDFKIYVDIIKQTPTPRQPSPWRRKFITRPTHQTENEFITSKSWALFDRI